MCSYNNEVQFVCCIQCKYKNFIALSSAVWLSGRQGDEESDQRRKWVGGYKKRGGMPPVLQFFMI